MKVAKVVLYTAGVIGWLRWLYEFWTDPQWITGSSAAVVVTGAFVGALFVCLALALETVAEMRS